MFNGNLKDHIKQEWLSKINLKVHYQPVIDLRGNRIYGYEALSRFEMEGSPVKPMRIFKMAERLGLLPELDLMCRSRAIEDFSEHHLGGYLFVNVFPAYLVSEYLGRGQTLKKVVESGINPSQVVLELNEATKVQDTNLLKKAIRYYRELGFGIAIDDVGTGFNSVQYLLELEGLLDYVKIPRELVDGVSRSKMKYNLVKVLTEVCTNAGAKVVYEGLEKEEDLLTLHHSFDAQLFQGFYFSQPLPPQEAKRYGLPPQMRRKLAKDHLYGKSPQTVRLSLSDRFYRLLEEVKSCRERYVLLYTEGEKYLVDVWKLKSRLDARKENLYHYKKLREVIDKEGEAFRDLDTVPSICIKTVGVKELFDRVMGSGEEVFLMEDGEDAKLIERYALLEHFYRKLIKELTDTNPLTNLPGNTAVEEKIRELGASQEEFWVCYVDLDNFKAYNDAYGFYLGDQMIKRVGFLLEAFRKENPDKVFVGHVGGDDFVILLWRVGLEEARNMLANLLRDLHQKLSEFYSPEDRKRGYFVSKDREGELIEFPIASVSAVLVKGSSDPADVSRRCALLKKKAKSIRGSLLLLEPSEEILTV